jgi:hypothetical protein
MSWRVENSLGYMQTRYQNHTGHSPEPSEWIVMLRVAAAALVLRQQLQKLELI